MSYADFLRERGLSAGGADYESWSEASKPVSYETPSSTPPVYAEAPQAPLIAVPAFMADYQAAGQPAFQQAISSLPSTETSDPNLISDYEAQQIIDTSLKKTPKQQAVEDAWNTNKQGDESSTISSGFSTGNDAASTAGSGASSKDKGKAASDEKGAGETGSDAAVAYTLSGQQLAKDDYAGIAASQYLADVLNGEYGDDWGRFQVEGTYDQWKAALESELLAQYFTDITGDARFADDAGAFNFDTYWNYVNGLNPLAMDQMAYDDWRLFNGTSAGVMNSYNNALASMMYEEGTDPREMAAHLNSLALAYGAQNGRTAADFSDDEIRFLNGLEMTPYGGDRMKGSPWGVSYRVLADPEFSYFEEGNPYLMNVEDMFGSKWTPDFKTAVSDYYGWAPEQPEYAQVQDADKIAKLVAASNDEAKKRNAETKKRLDAEKSSA